MKCNTQHPKVMFIILFIINLGLVVAIGILSFMNFDKSQNCAITSPIIKYYIIASGFTIIIVLISLCFPFYWVQRYTNSPGNLVWVFLFFLDWPWKSSQKYYIIALIVLSFTASFITLLGNLFAMCKGITVCVKKFIVFGWVISFIFTLLF